MNLRIFMTASMLSTLLLACLISTPAQAVIDRPENPVPAQHAAPPSQTGQDNRPEPFTESDPLEGFNRAMLSFNMGFHNTIGRPITKAYNALPRPVRTGLNNFFTNLGVPLTFINDLLQGKVEKAATDLMRFVINTTFGLGGLLDIASEAGMTYQKEDLGQTLYHWGLWKQSSFLILPILGPYTVREALGGGIETAYDPVYTALLEGKGDTQLALRVLSGLNSYANNAELIDQLNDQQDPYIFARESYLQYRRNLLYDGHPPLPEDPLDEIDL